MQATLAGRTNPFQRPSHAFGPLRNLRRLAYCAAHGTRDPSLLPDGAENMRAQQSDVRIGLCSVISLAAMTILVAWLFSPATASWPWRRTYAVHVVFDRPTTLQAGTRAAVGGIPIGRVRKVAFADPDSLAGGMLVELAVDSDHRLRRGSWARSIETASSGRASLQILPGASEEPPLEQGATIRGEVIAGMSALLSPEVVSSIDRSANRVGEAADKLAVVLDDFRTAVRPLAPATVDEVGGPPGNLTSALARLDVSLKSLNDLVGDGALRAELKSAVHNLYGISTDGKQLVADARVALSDGRALIADSQKLTARSQSAVEGVERRISDASQGLSDTLNLASTLLKELNAMVGTISRREGSLGKMLYDDQLYEALLLTLRRTPPEKP